MNKAKSMIMAARTALVLDEPFFGSLALNLPPVADPFCRTLATNGVIMKYNPAFIEGLTHDRIKACIAHEVMHVANGHPWRRDERAMKNWNIACDKPINHELREAGFLLPDGVVYATGDEVGKSAEWIYGRMLEEESKQNQSQQENQQPSQSQNGGGSATGSGRGDEGEEGDPDEHDGEQDGPQSAGNGPTGDGEPQGDPDPLGEVEDAPTGADENGEPYPTEQDWRQRVVTAITQAQLAGKMPGGIARQIMDSLQPRVDVRSLLLRFFSERSSSDYTWSRPNARYIAQGLYLPALEAHELGEVAIMVDTSGSMDEAALQYARSLVEAVIEECNPAAVTVYYSDAGVARVDHFAKGEPLEWRPAGGGGTDFRPCFEMAERDGNPVCMVAITDLEGVFPDVPPAFPVLWMVPKGPYTSPDSMAPFGDTVHFDQ